MWLRPAVHDELWYNQAQVGPLNGLSAFERHNRTTGAMGMIAQSVAEILGRHVTLSVQSIDRMYLNVYIPKLQSELGVVGFFKHHRDQPRPSAALMSPNFHGIDGLVPTYVRDKPWVEW